MDNENKNVGGVNENEIRLDIEKFPITTSQQPNLSQKDLLASDSGSISSRANNTKVI